MKHSRSPDLKSSSNVSLPFAWITEISSPSPPVHDWREKTPVQIGLIQMRLGEVKVEIPSFLLNLTITLSWENYLRANMRVLLTTWLVITIYISKISPNSARSCKIPTLASLWPTPTTCQMLGFFFKYDNIYLYTPLQNVWYGSKKFVTLGLLTNKLWLVFMGEKKADSKNNVFQNCQFSIFFFVKISWIGLLVSKDGSKFWSSQTCNNTFWPMPNILKGSVSGLSKK